MEGDPFFDFVALEEAAERNRRRERMRIEREERHRKMRGEWVERARTERERGREFNRQQLQWLRWLRLVQALLHHE